MKLKTLLFASIFLLLITFGVSIYNFISILSLEKHLSSLSSQSEKIQEKLSAIERSFK